MCCCTDIQMLLLRVARGRITGREMWIDITIARLGVGLRVISLRRIWIQIDCS